VSVRALLLYVLVYACFFAIFAAGPTTGIEMSVATGIVTAFVVADVWRGPHPADTPRRARCGVFVGCYSLAIALGGLICFILRVNAPPPPPAVNPPQSFLGVLFYFVTGAFLADLVHGLVAVLVPIIVFGGVFLLFSTLGLLASLFAVRHIRSAKWLALACLPGAGLLTAIWIGEMLGG
jgi:hypothetical protein